MKGFLKNRHIVAFVVMVSFLVTRYPPLALCQTTLRGQLELSEQLPPLDKALRKGKVFDQQLAERLLKTSDPSVRWVKIPEWIVGTWLTVECKTNWIRDEKTGKIYETSIDGGFDKNAEEAFGHARDSNGNIWSVSTSNYWRSAMAGRTDIYVFVRKFEMVTGYNEVMVKALTTNFGVNNRSNKIVDVWETELAKLYSKLSDGIVQEEIIEKTFDMDGSPHESVMKVCRISRIAAFGSRSYKIEGIDAQAAFDRYKQSHGPGGI